MNVAISLIIDLLLVALAAVTVFNCYRRGFAVSVLRFGRTIICFLLTIAFGPVISNFFADKIFRVKITNGILGKLESLYSSSGADSFFDSITEKFGGIFKIFGTDVAVLEAKFDSMTGTEAMRSLASDVAEPIVKVVSGICGYVVMFLLAFIAVTVVIGVFKILTKIPVIHSFDKILGLGFGVLSAFFYLVMITTLLHTLLVVITTVAPESTVMSAYDNSNVFRLFYTLVKKIGFFSWLGI